VPFVRPVKLAQDDTPGVEPVLHAIKSVPGFDYVVLLQPTSPLRAVEDIDGCIAKCINSDAPACVSVTISDKSPYWMFTKDNNDKLHALLDAPRKISRRQDLPVTYVLNGAVYVAECKWLIKNGTLLTADTVGYEMSQRNSLDIDNQFQFRVAELIMTEKI
jgi:N-acylneuraminate cytidylyltransferase